MATVYVITSGCYSDYHICAVSLDLKKAEMLKKFYEKIEYENVVDALTELNVKESYYIGKFDTYNNGYNMTMGGEGAVYADIHGDKGFCPARRVEVKDTTGAGDSFCAGVAIGLTYGKTLKEACDIGAMLAASVIVTSENVCPRFLPRELGLDMDVAD